MSISQPAKKLKILFVITQGELGGAQRYVFDLATHLPEHEVSVAMGTQRRALGKKLESSGVKVIYLANLIRNINPIKDILAVFELKRLIMEFQPHIIHLNSTKAGVIGSIAGRFANHDRVIFTAHGFAFLEPHLFKFIYFWAEKFASRFRQIIICVSEFDRQAAIKWKLCPPEKLITIHNGISNSVIASGTPRGNPIEIAPASPETRVEAGSAGTPRNDKKITIGTIAHDYPTKDLNTLRNAFQTLKSEFPNLELTIVGRGGTTSEVANAAEFLSKFDIYVCSSIKEGFPYSILEAMRAGLPVVSTAVGGIPEMMQLSPSPGDGEGQGERSKQFAALLVPPRNPQALAAAIKKLIQNPDLAQKLGTAAQKKVQEFSLNQMLKKTVEVYKQLIGG